MRVFLAILFKLLFKSDFIKKRHFGIHKRIIKPLNLFKGVTLKTKYNGFLLNLHIDDWIQENIYLLGVYEKSELSILDIFLNESSIFIDVGTNIGLYSLQASKTISHKGSIISFEPYKQNYNSFKKNIVVNKINNIHPENIAIGDTNGTIKLYYDEKEKNLGMVSTTYIPNANFEEVKVTTLDSYINANNITHVDFIKIDIEGHEYAALMGMKEVLQKCKPTLLIEILKDGNETNINSFLSSFGYKKYFITDCGNLSTSQTNTQRFNYIYTTNPLPTTLL